MSSTAAIALAIVAIIAVVAIAAGSALIRRHQRRLRWLRAMSSARLTRARALTTSARTQLTQGALRARTEREDRARFLATATHDLRQPIHAIGLFLGALDHQIVDGPARDILNRMHRAMRGVDDLSHRLLDLARLDTGAIEPHFSVFALAPILATLETRFQPLAKERRLALRMRARPGVFVRSDPTLAAEILMNLVSNAFRYTERGGILIALRVHGPNALLQVWDTGIGIAADDQARIFGEFVQVEDFGDRSRLDVRRGTGLGLAIVARLTAVIGGTARVHSTVGRGSVFELRLPLAEGPIADTATPATPAPAILHGLLVLVVDNHVDTLLAMESLLKSWGCYVLIGRTIAEALHHLARVERFPDLLITDHHLAEDTSVEVVAAVQDSIPVPLPVLVMSGNNDADTRALVARHEWSFLPKPVNPDQLRATIAGMVR